MGFRERLRRLERREGHDIVTLEDGTEIKLGPFDRLNALLSTLEGEDHWLADTLRELPADAPPDDAELRDLLIALEDQRQGSKR